MKIRITVLLLLLASVAHAQTKSDVVPDYKPSQALSDSTGLLFPQ
jgi:hypothetical protein